MTISFNFLKDLFHFQALILPDYRVLHSLYDTKWTKWQRLTGNIMFSLGRRKPKDVIYSWKYCFRLWVSLFELLKYINFLVSCWHEPLNQLNKQALLTCLTLKTTWQAVITLRTMSTKISIFLFSAEFFAGFPPFIKTIVHGHMTSSRWPEKDHPSKSKKPEMKTPTLLQPQRLFQLWARIRGKGYRSAYRF